MSESADNQSTKIDILEELVDELLKTSPEEQRIEKMMSLTGLNYCKDPLERLNTVLMALQFQEPVKNIED